MNFSCEVGFVWEEDECKIDNRVRQPRLLILYFTDLLNPFRGFFSLNQTNKYSNIVFIFIILFFIILIFHSISEYATHA